MLKYCKTSGKVSCSVTIVKKKIWINKIHLIITIKSQVSPSNKVFDTRQFIFSSLTGKGYDFRKHHDINSIILSAFTLKGVCHQVHATGFAICCSKWIHPPYLINWNHSYLGQVVLENGFDAWVENVNLFSGVFYYDAECCVEEIYWRAIIFIIMLGWIKLFKIARRSSK